MKNKYGSLLIYIYYKRVRHSASMHISSEIKQNARLKFHIHINTARSDWWLTTTIAKKREYCMYDVVLLVGKMIIPVIGPKPKQMYFLVWHTTIFFLSLLIQYVYAMSIACCFSYVCIHNRHCVTVSIWIKPRIIMYLHE